jgi:hypothetical protein
MVDLFTALFLISLGIFIWGMITPQKLSKLTKMDLSRKIVARYTGVLIVVLFVLIGITAPKQDMQNVGAAKTGSQQVTSKEKVKSAKVAMKTINKMEVIPFSEQQQNDTKLPQGQTKILQAGVTGEKTITYKITYTDGKETARAKSSEEITKKPINKIVAVGTYVAPAPMPRPVASTTPAPTNRGSGCNSNYSGCVPIASDVDCAGGTGNGPVYFGGNVSVIGSDVYDLDRNNNHITCD